MNDKNIIKQNSPYLTVLKSLGVSVIDTKNFSTYLIEMNKSITL